MARISHDKIKQHKVIGSYTHETQHDVTRLELTLPNITSCKNVVHLWFRFYLFEECLEPSARVISRWKNGNYYKGEIDSITNRVNVLFDNGARLAYSPRDNVDIVVDRIPDHSELPWGSQILVNRPRSRAFEIGYIRDIKNGRFVILYENGEEILHTLDQLRVFNKSRICGKCIK